MSVLLFSGHRLDGLHRAVPRFAPAQLPAVRQRLRGAVAGLARLSPPRAAVCSLAAGGDLLFAEACLLRRIPLHVVLPFRLADFVAQSVAYPKATGPALNWFRLYQRVLRAAVSVQFSTRSAHRSGAHQFLRANELMLQQARHLAVGRRTVVQALLLLRPGQPALAGGSQQFAVTLRQQRIGQHRLEP